MHIVAEFHQAMQSDVADQQFQQSPSVIFEYFSRRWDALQLSQRARTEPLWAADEGPTAGNTRMCQTMAVRSGLFEQRRLEQWQLGQQGCDGNSKQKKRGKDTAGAKRRFTR